MSVAGRLEAAVHYLVTIIAEVSARIPLPSRVRTSAIGHRPSNTAAIAAVVLFAAACGAQHPTAPSSADALSRRIVTAHFVFRLAENDNVDVAWQETYHAWAAAQLGVDPPSIEYNKYRNRAHMGAITGNGNTNGYAEPSSLKLHTIWPTDNHEVVHVYAGPWGFPVALFVEGLAVAYSTNPAASDFVARWNSTPVHELARRFRASGQLPAIADLAETNAFRGRDAGITYPVAGSFVRFLVDTEGIGQMRRLYGAMTNQASLSTVRTAFQQIYGFSLEEAERRWIAAVAE
jgi:hypothetical protein